MEDRTGSEFGPYRLNRLLGSGGFGEVYEAEDTAMHRVVALKLLNSAYSQDPVFRERLFREARTAGRLREPHVLPIHSCGEIDGQVYIDMRLVRGVDLETVLEREGTLEPQRAVNVVRQIAAALDAAHAETVLHRDVKPANVLLSGDDFASLVDFGLANAAGDARLTKTGKAVGTFDYVSPERLSSAPVDHRCDVYALACLLYEVLTGKTPYADHRELPELMAAHLTAPIPLPSQQRPDLAAFDEVIARGMAKNPDDRYPSAGALAAAARGALGHAAAPAVAPPPQPVPTLRPGPPPVAPPIPRQPPQQPPYPPELLPVRKSRRGKLIGFGALAVVAVLAVVIAAIWVIPWPGSHPQAAPKRPRPSSTTPTDLGFPPLSDARGVAVDNDGNVYAAELGKRAPEGRILKLPPGQNAPTELPFGEIYAQAVAADHWGNVYIADTHGPGVWKLERGARGPSMVPFGHLSTPVAVAVDKDGTVYVVDEALKQVLRMRAGSTAPKRLMPTTSLNNPLGVAVDKDGSVYVVDNGAKRVLKLGPDATDPTELPFVGLATPFAVAVDDHGNVYVTDPSKHHVLRLAPGANSSTELAFPGLRFPFGVATDEDGDIYVIDCENGDRCGNARVVELGAPA